MSETDFLQEDYHGIQVETLCGNSSNIPHPFWNISHDVTTNKQHSHNLNSYCSTIHGSNSSHVNNYVKKFYMQFYVVVKVEMEVIVLNTTTTTNVCSVSTLVCIPTINNQTKLTKILTMKLVCPEMCRKARIIGHLLRSKASGHR